MSTPGSRAMAAGVVVMILSVGAGMHFDGSGLLLCFVGVLVGANLLAIAVRTTDNVPVVLGGGRALAAFVRRNAAAMGLVMASCACTVLVSGEDDPVLCFAMFALLLLGLTLINIGARGA